MNSNLRLSSTICPMCGHGHLVPMVLMETLSCTLCQHMFAWDIRQQRIDVLDVSSPTAWRWTGSRWQRGPYPAQSLNTITIIFACIVILLPALMIEVAGYIFPPLPGSPFANFHFFWAGTALVLHGASVFWILAESYHFTPYILAKVRMRELLHRLQHQHL